MILKLPSQYECRNVFDAVVPFVNGRYHFKIFDLLFQNSEINLSTYTDEVSLSTVTSITGDASPFHELSKN